MCGGGGVKVGATGTDVTLKGKLENENCHLTKIANCGFSFEGGVQ